jgi:hypothetical protein
MAGVKGRAQQIEKDGALVLEFQHVVVPAQSGRERRDADDPVVGSGPRAEAVRAAGAAQMDVSRALNRP